MDQAGTPTVPRSAYCFDDFVLDLSRGALLNTAGSEIPLRPKSFALLRLLVENSGRLVDRDAIMAAVWPGVFVTDESVAQCIKDVRRALGDDTQRLIRTIPKRGYRLETRVLASEPQALHPTTTGDPIKYEPLHIDASAPGQPPGAGVKTTLRKAEWADVKAERQFAAVVFLDVVGYSRLMEADEASTLRRWVALRRDYLAPRIANWRGRIVDRAGDGLLIKFETALDAVRWALDVQAALTNAPAAVEKPPIFVRISIHIGDIIEAIDGAIYGNDVNIAARLQTYAEPGCVVVSKAVMDQVRSALSVPWLDLGGIYLKNISSPVHSFHLLTRKEAIGSARPDRVRPDPRPSIAVLPFRKNDFCPEEAYFTDGIIEGIIHVLARLDGLSVISRGSTLRYTSAVVDPRAIGCELRVRYVLHGSVRRSKDSLRIAIELSDTETGMVIIADRYEGHLDELFELQDRISSHVATTIAPQIRRRELQQAMRKHPDSMTGYDLVLQALDLLYRLDRPCFHRARGLLQEAAALDPGYAPAHSHAATWHMFRVGQGWSASVMDDIAAAGRCALVALEHDREDAVALAIHGHMLSFARRDYGAAIEFLDHAIVASPSCHMAWVLRSATCGYTGDGHSAAECARRAIELSPFDPFAFFAHHMLSQALYISGEHEEAVTWGRRALAHNGLLTSNLRTLAAALVATGRLEEAREVARRMLAVDPDFKLTNFAARTPLQPEILETLIPRLRAAGLPD